MTIEKMVLSYLAKQQGITEEQAAELLYQKSENGEVDKTKLKDDALQLILDKDAERVANIKKSVDTTEIFNQAYAKARKEELGKAEKNLAKKFGIKDDLKLEPLVEAIVAKRVESLDVNKELTEDKIKAHPTYLALERAKTDELKTIQTEHQKKLDEIQSGYARKDTLQTVKGKVLTYFDNLKPVLSKDGVKAANQRSIFANMFDQFEYKIEEGQDEPLVLKDGKRLEDKHGNPVSLEKLVTDTAAQYYDFAKQDPKGGPGNGGEGTQGGNGVNVPKNEDEYNTAMFEATTTEERVAIKDAWESSQGG